MMRLRTDASVPPVVSLPVLTITKLSLISSLALLVMERALVTSTLSMPAGIVTLAGGFHDAKAWGEKVGQPGIGPDSHVVVYGSVLTETARVWWTLKYLGHENVTILDGGWQLWLKEKRPTEATTPNIEVVKYEPKFQADRLEEIDSLKKSVGSVTSVTERCVGSG